MTTTENGSAAYHWLDKNMNESIVQFYFQCVIGNKNDHQSIVDKYDELFQRSLKYSKQPENFDKRFLKYMIKLCLQTRDIQYGKGLCKIAYLMLETIAYYVYEKKCISKKVFLKLLKTIVKEPKRKEKHYGSWKDLKYFLHIFLNPQESKYEFTRKSRYEIATQIINKIYIHQMIKDRKRMSVSKPISLCGKWLPRESSKKFGYIGRMIAKQYHNNVIMTRISNTEKFKKYRILIEKFNSYLDTTQTYMNQSQWSHIDFETVTNGTLLKYKKAFLNHKNIKTNDRQICKYNFTKFLNDKMNTTNVLRVTNNILPHDLVKQAIVSQNVEELNLLNMQWNGLVENLLKNKTHFMKFCIPCIDVSPSMYQNNATPLHSAIGMGLLCTEVSNYNKAFTFSTEPTWFNFNQASSFVDKVQKIKDGDWGSSTNIFALFMKILKACQERNISNEHLSEHSLIVFSDMQFDVCNNATTEPYNDTFKQIRDEYQKYGYTNVPFLIFWNLRKTDNFPSIEKTPNMLKLSGSSASLLSILMDTRLQDLKQMSNWNIVQNILDNHRYNLLDHLF